MNDKEALDYLNGIVSSPCERRNVVVANHGVARDALVLAVRALAEKVAMEGEEK